MDRWVKLLVFHQIYHVHVWALLVTALLVLVTAHKLLHLLIFRSDKGLTFELVHTRKSSHVSGILLNDLWVLLDDLPYASRLQSLPLTVDPIQLRRLVVEVAVSWVLMIIHRILVFHFDCLSMLIHHINRTPRTLHHI